MTCLLAFPSCATCLPSFASPVGVLHLLIVVPNWWAHCNIMTIHNDAVVRLAQPSDCATIADYNCRMAKETEDLELDRDTVLAGVAAILQDPSKGRYYLVEGGGHDAPVAQLMITLEWSDWRNAQVWWVQSVYVHPEHRRRGYYRVLYQHVREAAKQEGVAGIRLYADTGNVKAHSTYESLGMTSHYKVFEEMFGGF